MRNLLSIAVLSLGSLFAATGCGGPIRLAARGTAQAPGVDAAITVAEPQGGARVIQVVLTNLLPPNRLGSDLTRYVVWLVPQGQPAVLGAFVTYDADERRGNAQLSAAYPEFEVVVSAEAATPTMTPSEHVVVRQGFPARARPASN